MTLRDSAEHGESKQQLKCQQCECDPGPHHVVFLSVTEIAHVKHCLFKSVNLVKHLLEDIVVGGTEIFAACYGYLDFTNIKSYNCL